MKKCERLADLPPVIGEWQQNVYEPKCKHFGGQCDCNNPERQCPFHGKELPLRPAKPPENDEN